MTDYKRIREALRVAREHAPMERDGIRRPGMTLDEVAAATGLNRASIHKLENIKRKPNFKPKLETIEVLAHTYGLTLSSLFSQIEALPEGTRATDDQASATSAQARANDETLPTLTPEEWRLLYSLGKAVAKVAAHTERERESERGAHRRHGAETGDEQTEDGARPRDTREGTDEPRRRQKRRVKKTRKR